MNKELSPVHIVNGEHGATAYIVEKLETYSEIAGMVRRLYTAPSYDLTNIEVLSDDADGIKVRYKSVHSSVRSAEDRPYRYVTFKNKIA